MSGIVTEWGKIWHNNHIKTVSTVYNIRDHDWSLGYEIFMFLLSKIKVERYDGKHDKPLLTDDLLSEHCIPLPRHDQARSIPLLNQTTWPVHQEGHRHEWLWGWQSPSRSENLVSPKSATRRCFTSKVTPQLGRCMYVSESDLRHDHRLGRNAQQFKYFFLTILRVMFYTESFTDNIPWSTSLDSRKYHPTLE